MATFTSRIRSHPSNHYFINLFRNWDERNDPREFFSLSIVFNFKTARENWPSNAHRKNYFSHFCNQFKTGTNALLKQKKGNLFSSSSSPLSFYFYLWVKTKCDEIIIEQNWKRACPLASLIIKCYMKSFFFFLDKYNTIFIHFNSF